MSALAGGGASLGDGETGVCIGVGLAGVTGGCVAVGVGVTTGAAEADSDTAKEVPASLR